MTNNNLADRLVVALGSRKERAMRQAFEDIRAAGLRFAVEYRSGLLADNEDWIIRTALINHDAPVAAVVGEHIWD